MTRIIGGKDARPWGLVLGLDEHGDELVDLFPYAQHVSSLAQFEQREFDVVVTDETVVELSIRNQNLSWKEPNPQLTVVSFGGRLPRVMLTEDEERDVRNDDVGRMALSRTRSLNVLEAPSPEISSLATELATYSTSQIDSNRGFWHSTLQPQSKTVRAKLKVVLETSDGKPVVAHWLRGGSGNPEVWALPPYADSVAWTRAILNYLASSRGDWVPPTPEPDSWRLQPEWLTGDEMKVRLLVDEELSRHDEENERHKKTIAELQSLRLDAETVANEEFLGLVANDGDELARSVGSALEFLDFQVEYLDDVREEGDKREDLRIRLPDVDDWEVIAEVRSYKGGAKEESYHRLVSKFIPGYILEKQRRPDCIWWFANTFRGRDLRERQPIMVSKPDLIQAFADIGGLAVDTADLLHLVLQVDRGEITREKARDRLVEATGVLKEFDRSPG